MNKKGKVFLETPDDVDLWEFFGCEPIRSESGGWFWIYEIHGENNVKLIFICNAFNFSIQTDLLIGDQVLMSVYHENATEMRISGDRLICKFDTGNLNTQLEVVVKGGISCKWLSMESSLLMRNR